MRWTYLRPKDVHAWEKLVTTLATVDGTEEFYSAEDLAEELAEDDLDPHLDTIAVWQDEELAAFGHVSVHQGKAGISHQDGRVRVNIGGGVDPRWRGQGIGTRLLDQLEARARQLSVERHWGVDITLRVFGGLEGDPVRPLLMDRGYEVARYFTVMSRPLPGQPLPEDAQLVAEKTAKTAAAPRATAVSEENENPNQPVSIRELTPEYFEATRLAHNDAFATHWGTAPTDEAGWRSVVSSHSARPAYSRIAVTGEAEATVLAYCTVGQWTDRELYITLVGTRQSARGQGLARKVLKATVAAAAASGEFDVIELDVDSANPTGAGALYTSIGFTPVRTTAFFTKEEPAPRIADLH